MHPCCHSTLASALQAVLVALILWAAILTMIIAFFRVSPAAAYLQIPYLLWVSFASVLNGTVVYLNR